MATQNRPMQRDPSPAHAAHAAEVQKAHEIFREASAEERLRIVREGFNPRAHAKRLREFAEWLDRLEAGQYSRPDLHAFDILEALAGRVGIMSSDAAAAFGLKAQVEAFYAAVDSQSGTNSGKAAPDAPGPRG